MNGSIPTLDAHGESVGSSLRWFWLLVMAGCYLTLRGYHAFDGDQAYRLPLLLHRQVPALFNNDPFVQAFDTFNPHRGYLALLDWASRPLGLATALAALFALTWTATMLGVDRLARAGLAQPTALGRDGGDWFAPSGEGRQYWHEPPVRGNST